MHLAAPTRANVYLLARCNYRCAHCYSADYPDGPRLNADKYGEMFRRLSEAGVFEVVFLGGEPMLRPDFLEVVERAIRTPLAVLLSTNASLVTLENRHRLAELLDGRVQVSLDGHVASVNDAVRGPGTFDRTVRGLKLLLEAGCRVSLGCVVSKPNIALLPGILDFAVTNDIKAVHFMRFVPKGAGLRELARLSISNAEWLRAVATLRRCTPPGVRVQIDGTYEYPPEGSPLATALLGCACGRSEVTILPSGEIVPCENMEHMVAGNILSDDLLRIWRTSEVFSQFRVPKKIHEGDCGACRVGYCRGCRYLALLHSGRWLAADPYCVNPAVKGVPISEVPPVVHGVPLTIGGR